ncbi:hypothetical protein CBR_g66682 [Chara braunii]|uniref:Integrase catalytic domain-containing protein n=1 Tax=Chara braunii TaxID=69332 RepID=A0A388JQ09_CHABU|nr:hypothetical protein CBR_g66682 [Chara braunii]|eukprot:GBG59875.1 hypothetical protein CBR_g66682 [Chara braunii]
MSGSDSDEGRVDDTRLTRSRSCRVPYVFQFLQSGDERRLRVEVRARAYAAAREAALTASQALAAANAATREQATATASAAAMATAATSSTASSSGTQLGMPHGPTGTSGSVGSSHSTSQMTGSQLSPLTPRGRELQELQQVERIRTRLERELKQATNIKNEIINRTTRLDTFEADKAALEELDDSTMFDAMKVLRSSILSLHAYVDSRLDFMQNSLDQILDLLQRLGLRPAAQSPLSLTAMSSPFPIQTGTQPSGTSAAAAQTVASTSSGPAAGATPQPQQFIPPQGRQKSPWYPKTPMKPPLAFSGEKKDEELNTWLRTVSMWVRAKRTLQEEEVITVASYLEGATPNRPVASTLANKERMVVTYYVKDVVCTFSYGGGELNHKISFLVSDDLPFDMLLGMYYLEVANPQFDWDKKVLKHELPDGRTWIQTQPVLSDALKRWIEVIEQYDFEIDYLKREYNKVVDALSRRAYYLGALVTKFDISDDVTRSLEEAYRKDHVTMDIIHKLQVKDKGTEEEFVMVDGLLFLRKDGIERFVVPSSKNLRILFLGECHDATGHFGYKKSSVNLVQRFWGPSMLDDEKKYVETCEVCQRDKLRTQAPLGLLKPLPIPAGRGQSVSMDFMDTLVTRRSGKRHIFVIIDRFTKYAKLIVMPETARTEHVIKLFMDNWVRDFGLPKSIVSDRDVHFTSELWKKTVEQMGSQLQMTYGNHPEANRQAKQMNKVVQHLLRHYIKPNQDDWDEKLPLIASLYNNVVHSTTSVSPNQLHLGWKPSSALDFLLPENQPAATPGTLEFGVQYEKLKLSSTSRNLTKQ